MQIIPFYALCDESSSMKGEPVKAINESLVDLHKELSVNPTVADRVRFGLIGFSNEPEVLLELSDLSEVSTMPGLNADGLTYYGKAFNTLRETIQEDIADLKAEGHQVFRPVVFFMSDGAPTDRDTWTDAHNELISPSFSGKPKIVAFGIGKCDPEIIKDVATFKAFIQNSDSVSPADALREFATALSQSIVKSASRSTSDGPTLDVQDEVPGFTSITLDEV